MTRQNFEFETSHITSQVKVGLVFGTILKHSQFTCLFKLAGLFFSLSRLFINASQLSYGFVYYFACAEELVTGLSRVSWEKVDVSFHNSRSKFAAHSVIQVHFFLYVFLSYLHPHKSARRYRNSKTKKNGFSIKNNCLLLCLRCSVLIVWSQLLRVHAGKRPQLAYRRGRCYSTYDRSFLSLKVTPQLCTILHVLLQSICSL